MSHAEGVITHGGGNPLGRAVGVRPLGRWAGFLGSDCKM